MRKHEICSCCGQTKPAQSGIKFYSSNNRIVFEGKTAFFTPTTFKAFEALHSAYPQAALKENIHFYLYGDDPNGGPIDQVITQWMYRLKKEIGPLGMTIENYRSGSWTLKLPVDRA